jgi:hypothetical protein
MRVDNCLDVGSPEVDFSMDLPFAGRLPRAAPIAGLQVHEHDHLFLELEVGYAAGRDGHGLGIEPYAEVPPASRYETFGQQASSGVD